MSKIGYRTTIVRTDKREFLVQLVIFENGIFVSVTEGKEKLGGMVVSITSGLRTSTVTIIPSKSESLFIKMISERLSNIISGICLVSINTEKDLKLEDMKLVMNEIMEKVKT